MEPGTKKIKIFVLGEKGLRALQYLSDLQLKLINEVVIGQDKNIINDFSKEISSLCENLELDYRYRKNDVNMHEEEILVAIGWRWLIHTSENQELFVFHDSLLPKYRGFNPLVSALINGEKEIGVTCLKGSSEYDQGDIISQKKINISYPITIGKAIQKVSLLYGELLFELFDKLTTSNCIQTYPQDPKSVSYSVWRDSEDYRIDWNQPAEKIERFIDAVSYPYLGARTLMDDTEIIIEKAKALKGYKIENNGIGKVLFKKDNKPIVICGSGLLQIEVIKGINGEKIEFPQKFRFRFQ